MKQQKDLKIIRDLARKYAEIAAKPVQNERRDLWRRHNSLERTRTLILVMPAGRAWAETPEVQTRCEDDFLRGWEGRIRRAIYMDFIGDDTIAEPWLTMGAAHITPPDGPWGPKYGRIPSPDPNGAWKFDPPIKRLEDIDLVAEIQHVIDDKITRERHDRINSAIGDIIPIHVSRAPFWRHWRGDISTDIAYLRGLEQVMWDMAENPEWLHRLVGKMSEGIQRVHAQAEAAGDWHLCDHTNQAMPYCKDLADPQPDGPAVKRSHLWTYFAAQEMAQVSPAMHEEFMLNYQLPIMKHFGLSAYGCCEDLTKKIGMLRKIPNLRRIAVTPVADVAKCAEQIGTDYVFSWRPNPAQMICCGYDPDLITRVVRDAMEKSRGCHVDLTLKDVESVQGKPENLRNWVRLVRSITDRYA